MKAAEEILERIKFYTIEDDSYLYVKENFYYQYYDVVQAIEQAQKDAYNQAIDDAYTSVCECGTWVDVDVLEAIENLKK